MSYTAFLILILIVAIALILIVMVQNPKGGGLSSSFGGGGAQSLGGVQNTNNFLDRTTWTLAITMFALILLANFAIPRGGDSNFKLDNTLDGIETTTPAETTTPSTNDSLKHWHFFCLNYIDKSNQRKIVSFKWNGTISDILKS
jgi:preprotein translocase subunit SecG